MPQILAFAGSARSASFNVRLVLAAAAHARAAGATVTVLDFADYPMPLYDGDAEETQGTPDTVTAFKAQMAAHDGLLIACPEYNSSITPLLKNAIDWASRPAEGEPPLASFSGKVAGLLAASPGQLGGLRGLVTVRSILSSIGVIVTPTQAAVGSAHGVFADDGTINDERLDGRVKAVAEEVVNVTRSLHGSRA